MSFSITPPSATVSASSLLPLASILPSSVISAAGTTVITPIANAVGMAAFLTVEAGSGTYTHTINVVHSPTPVNGSTINIIVTMPASVNPTLAFRTNGSAISGLPNYAATNQIHTFTLILRWVSANARWELSSPILAIPYDTTRGVSEDRLLTPLSLGPKPMWGELNLRKLWAQLNRMNRAQAWAEPQNVTLPARAVCVGLGDSIAWRIWQTFVPFLQSAYGWGGQVGRWAGETLFNIQTNTGTIIGDPTGGPFTSPIGELIRLTPSQLIAVGLGNETTNTWTFGSGTNRRLNGDPVSNGPRTNITEVVVYFARVTGAGTFAVEYSTDNSNWVTVPGLGSVNAATGGTATRVLGIARATGLSNLSMGWLRVRNTGGSGDVDIFGGGAMRSTGVVLSSFSRGGMAMLPAVSGNTLFSSLMQDLQPTVVFAHFLDEPTDTSSSLNRAAYNALILSNLSTLLVNAGDPDVIYCAPNGTSVSDTEDTGRVFCEKAVATNKTFLDVRRIIGPYAEANANNIMNDGVHASPYMLGMVVATLLGSTNLNCSPYMSNPWITPAPGTAPSFRIGDATTYIEAANLPNRVLDVVTSANNNLDCAIALRNTFGPQREVRLINQVSSGSAIFRIRDHTASRDMAEVDMGNNNFKIGALNGRIQLGHLGDQISYVRRGVLQLNSGQAVVNNSAITSTTSIFLSRGFREGTAFSAQYEYIVANGSFTVIGRDANDNIQTGDRSYLAWLAIQA